MNRTPLFSLLRGSLRLRPAVPAAILIALAAIPLSGQVEFSKRPGQIDVVIDSKPFTTLYMSADVPKPYLHPLRSAGGKIVTRHFPMEEVAGESHDHPHHRGLWLGYGNISGTNFWENEFSYKTTNRGKIVLEKLIEAKGGKKKGTIEAIFNWQDPQGNTMLQEHRTMVFYSDKDKRTIDFDITLKAVTKLTFEDTKEGTFALRVADALNEQHTGTLTNAEGATKMNNVWGKPSAWVDDAGEIDGEKLGVAVFDHPSNPRHPAHWHARDYGLLGANSFGIREYEKDKTKDGSLTLEPGKSLRFRYRVLIHPGDTASAKIAEEYSAYVHGK